MDTKKIRVAINGFGRIGRAFLKISWDRTDMEIVAINDLGTIQSLAYLLRHDTVYKNWDHIVGIDSNFDGTNASLVIDNKKVKFISEKDTSKLPWKELDVDVVVESTGLFTSFDKAKFHIDCGAKKVVISAPSKGSDSMVPGETILLGINEEKFGICDILRMLRVLRMQLAHLSPLCMSRLVLKRQY
jgi:glyceraldehyde 3-phosphate dehydrogenase